ncbi:hypothetical protein Agub_g14856, partial [Astrephomene gubernaculifera]
MEPEVSDDDQICGQEQSFFEEAAELDSLIKRVIESDGKEAQQIYNRYKAILYKYQEQSQLLDAYLEGIVVPLASLLRKQAVLQQEQGVQRVLSTCRLLNVLVVVRGYKTVVRFFPHEAADLERVLDILETVKAQRPKDNEEGIAMWEAQTMLLLWLSILILIPFDLATVDSAATGAKYGTLPYTPLVGRILALCKEYLHHPGGVREMSAVVLGRLLTRPDMAPAMSEFLDWAPGALAGVDPLRAPFLLPGVMQALCCAFKLGQRDRLLPFASRAWALATRLMATHGSLAASSSDSSSSGGGGNNVLSRKLSVKLVTRIGLTFMAPRAAPWRYVRGGASLDETLRAAGSSQPASAAASTQDNDGKAKDAEAQDADGEEDEDASIEIAAEIEEVVEALLAALRDRDTVVRWSGAKGVGRVTGCLPRELGDEVVGSVMQLFGPTESDTAWHGGCLALAELARRGLLLPARLPALLPVLRAALCYDVRRGPHSIGAHVRDAGAYVCWAFARAYEPELLSDSLPSLASSLLTTACFDREVNCRRAAAAAFQEAVGRLGGLPHGIELLGVADYFSVGITQQAYLRVAPSVARLAPELAPALSAHLVHVKSRHWEKALRQLAGRAAAALVPHLPGYWGGEALEVLLPACLDAQLEVRHGAVVMIAELLPALAATATASSSSASTSSSDPTSSTTSSTTPAEGATSPTSSPCWPLPPALAASIAGLLPAIERARLYRGKGGEVMREAVCGLVAGVAAVGLGMSEEQHGKVLESLDENLRHPQPYIQAAAVAALRAYARSYLSPHPPSAASFLRRYLPAYLSRLHDPNVAVRRGYGRALGGLPRELLEGVEEQALHALLDGCQPEQDPEQRDVESRVNCMRGLGMFIETMYGSASGGCSVGDSSSADVSNSADGDVGSNGEGGEDAPAPAAPVGSAAPGAVVGPNPHAAEVLRNKVLPCLTSSLEDYTTDNRGDVGSWVREAAMRVMTAVAALLPRCCGGGDSGQQQQQQQQQQEELTAIIGRVMGLLLRQSVERISRVRESALRHVRTLLADTALLPYIPAADRVAAAAEAAADAATDAGGVAASLDALHRVVVRLLAVPPYTEPILEGLVASIGGVDSSLAKAASQALLEALAAKQQDTDVSGGGGGGGAEASSQSPPPLLSSVAGYLLDVWSRHAKSSRMATPLLRTALLLLTKAPGMQEVTLPRPPPPQAVAATGAAAAASAAPASSAPSDFHSPANNSNPSSSSTTSRFPDHLVEAVRAETRGCSDVGRLLDAASLLCHLVPYPGHCRTSALQGLMVLLCSRYPKVRRHTAEQLYLQLLALDSSTSTLPPPTSISSSTQAPPPPPLEQLAEEAADLLLATCW